MRNIKPYVFLTLLLLIVTFIGGVKYGNKVQQINKEIAKTMVISPSPTKLVPTTPPIQLSTYLNKSCGLQFVYPSTLRVEDATRSAELKDHDITQIGLSCLPVPLYAKPEQNVATTSVSLKGTPMIVTLKENKNMIMYSFRLKNPKKGTSTAIDINADLYPLFESTLQYLP